MLPAGFALARRCLRFLVRFVVDLSYDKLYNEYTPTHRIEPVEFEPKRCYRLGGVYCNTCCQCDHVLTDAGPTSVAGWADRSWPSGRATAASDTNGIVHDACCSD